MPSLLNLEGACFRLYMSKKNRPLKFRPAIIHSDYALIPLGDNAKHGYAIVDIEDAYLADRVWTANGHGYAVRTEYGGKNIFMHHAVNGRPDAGKVTDHIDGNPLNNRRSNLRNVFPYQNQSNMKPRGDRKYKGVQYRGKNWRVQIVHRGKLYTVGKIKTELEAAKKYNELALKLQGEYARLNKI